MLDLPTELLEALLPSLGVRELVSLRQTSRALRQLVTEAPAGALRPAAQGLPRSHPVHQAASLGAFLATQSRVARAVAAGPGAWARLGWDPASRCRHEAACSPDGLRTAEHDGRNLVISEARRRGSSITVQLPVTQRWQSRRCGQCFWSSCSAVVGFAEELPASVLRVGTYKLSTGQLLVAELRGNYLVSHPGPRFLAAENVIVLGFADLAWSPRLCVVHLRAADQHVEHVCPYFPQGGSFAASVNGDLAFQLRSEGDVCVWRPGIYHRLERCRDDITGLDWSPAGDMVAVLGESEVLILSASGQRLARLRELQQLVASPAWCLSGLLLMDLSDARKQAQRLYLVEVTSSANHAVRLQVQSQMRLQRGVQAVLGPMASPDLCFVAFVVSQEAAYNLLVLNVGTRGRILAAPGLFSLDCVWEGLPLRPLSIAWVPDGLGIWIHRGNGKTSLVEFLR